MREIKFRVWILSKNRWMTAHIANKNIYAHSKDKDLVIQQYTGLKDKNGVEIYEGDIVFLKNWNDHIPSRFDLPLDEKRKVTFQDGCFCVQELIGDAHCHVGYINLEYCEVIGNIYESPELLEQS